MGGGQGSGEGQQPGGGVGQPGGGVLEYDELFIGGVYTAPAGSETIEVVSPHTERVIGRVPHASREDVDRAVTAARRAFDEGPWPRLSLAERAALVGRIRDGIKARAEEFARLIGAQNGSPYSWGIRAQALGAAAIWTAYLRTAEGHPFEERRQGQFGLLVVRREPVGVVAAVAPWNVPQFVAAAKLAPALLAGCTVVLKPSPETPLDSYLLAEVVREAGLPEGVLSILPADRDVSAHLVAHPGVDKVSFTGSVAAGQQIMASAARTLKRVTLELGGKSAAIVLPDADLDTAVKGLLASAFMNNGQACVAQTRVLLPRERYEEIADRLTSEVAAFKVGDPLDPATEIGPLVTRRQQQRSLDYIALGEREGAKLLTGGGRPAGQATGWYVEPTLFGEVDNGMRIAQEEIFGPVVCLIPYEGEAEAVRLANDSVYGLSGSVWTADPDRGLDLARRVRTGTFSVNTFSIDYLGPFGGYKQSGLGREFGPEGLDEYLESKTISLPR
ncbi:aldehyde dehydrogenase [Kitasatospora sp. MMS16-BH015]|uniref:aldehyde dehydrogenase n=1 Tax=Kitasatospora sp. MMS16-BH015 TaxID=2018025 RepID=UPI000CA32BB9|nr:aldehyde dehydrogenase [Kitasatospora sp. MMS16-BH015]AUG76981.1 aldehyde dehydrogenase [Kitasatospora sp. MMS16-BH015]